MPIPRFLKGRVAKEEAVLIGDPRKGAVSLRFGCETLERSTDLCERNLFAGLGGVWLRMGIRDQPCRPARGKVAG